MLDIVLPERDGISILRQLRRSGNTTPVLFLTARSEVQDRAFGLDAGADPMNLRVTSFFVGIFAVMCLAGCSRRETTIADSAFLSKQTRLFQSRS